MPEPNNTDSLALQLRQAQEHLAAVQAKKALLERLSLEKALAEAAERKAAAEQAQRAAEEEAERRSAAIVEARRQKEQAWVKAKRDEELAQKRLEEQAERLRNEQAERQKREDEVRKVQQAAFDAEREAQRIEQELQRKNQPAPEPERPKTLADGPLAMIFGGRTVEPVATQRVVVPPQRKPDLQYTQAELNYVLSQWPSTYRPELFEVGQLLKEFPADAIVEAVKTLTSSWQNNAQQPNYCLAQIRHRLSAQENIPQ